MSYRYHQWSLLMTDELMHSFSSEEKEQILKMSDEAFGNMIDNNRPKPKELVDFLKSTVAARQKNKKFYSSFGKKLSTTYHSLVVLKCGRQIMESFELNLNGPYRLVIAQTSWNAYVNLDPKKIDDYSNEVYYQLRES